MQLVDVDNVNDEFQAESLKFINGQFWLRKEAVQKASEHFKLFYKTKLQKKLKDRFKLYQSKMGVEPTDVKVMELQNRTAVV